MVTTTLDVLGRSLRVDRVPPLWAEWLRQRWQPVRHEVLSLPFTIGLEPSPPQPRPAHALPQTVVELTRSLSVWTTPRQCWWADAERGVLVTLGADTPENDAISGHINNTDVNNTDVNDNEATNAVRIRAWGLAKTPTRDVAAVLSLAVQEGLRTSGLVPLHGSAAIAPGDDAATIFLGPSGRGKTTTLLRAMRAGWQPVCEDLAWLEPDTGRLYGWNQGLSLLPDALARLAPDYAARPPTRGEKTLLPFREIAADLGVTWQPAARLGRIVSLERGSGTGSWQPLLPREAVPLLWEATSLPLLTSTRQQTAAQIASLVARHRLERLVLGEEVEGLELFRR